MTTLIRRETLLHPLDLRTHPRRDALRRDGSLNRLEVVETGRRRRWSAEEKARIVLESMSEPRLIAATSRRYGLSRSGFDLAEGSGGGSSQTREELCQSGCGQGWACGVGGAFIAERDSAFDRATN
jgi:hypothetical protein